MRLLCSHMIVKLDHAVAICFHVSEMKRDVLVDLVEEWDSVTNKDRHDRIANFIRKPDTKAFRRKCPASNKPDALKRGSQSLIHKLCEVAGIKLDAVSNPRQISMSQDECR